jgi:hypothetical protein
MAQVDGSGGQPHLELNALAGRAESRRPISEGIFKKLSQTTTMAGLKR